MKELAFLWREDGTWFAKLPSGPGGAGPDRDAALAALRRTLHERHAAMRRAAANEEIGSLDFDRCLLVRPDAFEAWLESTCTRARRPHFAFGVEDRALDGIEDAPASSLFLRHRILWLTSTRYALALPSHWHPMRRGLFAFDGDRLLPLHGRPDSLEAVFRVEARSLEGSDPFQLAGLFAEALGRRGPLDHVLATGALLDQMEASGDYVIDRAERDRIAPFLEPASIVRRPEGWVLRFATLFGWNAERQAVSTWCVRWTHDFDLDVRMEPLCDRIFAVTPIVSD